MHNDLKGQILRGLHPEHLTAYHKMAAAAHRQKLRKTLDKTKQYGFKPFHTP